ncbi:unnamed protein product [Caenorhabditis auriculariae]|uniref:Globin domain-containing protein n=1 Tax=Caenorhabditis auriculariae TaxID=2777116 RepID=A0A8S1H9C4_9PELO|nr:unnamed protein product [Caenorhabditis auriculariae]
MEDLHLTSEEKDMIKRSWKVLQKNLNQTAICIFEMIFTQSPDAKQLFPFMRISQSTKSREMEFHALRFMQVLESVVKFLNDPTMLNPLCDNLGRIHGRLSETRGFRTHHWSVFVECTLFHLRRVLAKENEFSELQLLDQTILCWRSILLALIERMKKFDEAPIVLLRAFSTH